MKKKKMIPFPSEKETPLRGLLHERQGQNLALPVVCVPCSLDSGKREASLGLTFVFVFLLSSLKLSGTKVRAYHRSANSEKHGRK